MPPKYTKRPWLPSEDQLLHDAVMSLGAPEFAVKGCEKSGVRWTDIAKLVPDRAAKQCRERWRNHLDPGVSREAWTEEENAILLQRYEQFGSMWAEIASGLPGRADNGCKNQWNKLMGWGSSASRPRKSAQLNGEQPPKKARRDVPPGSMVGRPASRGEGGAAAGTGPAGATPWAGGALVAAGRPAPSSHMHTGLGAGGYYPPAASAAAAAAAPQAADADAPFEPTSSKHRVRSQRRGRGMQRRHEAPPPHRPTAQDRRRAMQARRPPAPVAPPAPAPQPIPIPIPIQPVRAAPVRPAPPTEIQRDWKTYSAQAHKPVGSPREPTNFPPPARLLHSSRAAAAAAVVPEDAMVVELTGHVLTERLPARDGGRLSSSAAADGAGGGSQPLKGAAEQATGSEQMTLEASERVKHAAEDSKGTAEGVGDTSRNVVGD